MGKQPEKKPNVFQRVVVGAGEAYGAVEGVTQDAGVAMGKLTGALGFTGGLPASRHFDLALGIDVHPFPPPPLLGSLFPAPYVGIVFDPFEYLTDLANIIGGDGLGIQLLRMLGGSVYVNGRHKTIAGTMTVNFPHIPWIAANQGEVFMGSSTVLAEGEPFTYAGLPVLSCWFAGIDSPPRPPKLKKSWGMKLPTTFIIPLPTSRPVIIGGPPTISFMSLLESLLDTALGKAFDAVKRKAAKKAAEKAAKEAAEKAAKEAAEKAAKEAAEKAAKEAAEKAAKEAAEKAAKEAAEKAAEKAAKEAAEKTAKEASEKAAKEAAEASKKAAKEAAEASKKAAKEAAEASKKAARDAAEASKKAAKDAAEASKKAAKEAAEASEKAAKEAAEASKKAAKEAAEASEKAAKDAAEKTAKEAAENIKKADNVIDLPNKPSDKVNWVDENANMSDRARKYDAGAPGSRSNLETGKGQAPSLNSTTPEGKPSTVRFDGVEGDVMIDRKISVVTTSKAKNQALRQSEALRQNGLTGRWEVPTQAQANRAEKMFKELGVDNINVKVVPE